MSARVLFDNGIVERAVREMRRLFPNEPLEGAVITENGHDVVFLGAREMDDLCAWWSERRHVPATTPSGPVKP